MRKGPPAWQTAGIVPLFSPRNADPEGTCSRGKRLLALLPCQELLETTAPHLRLLIPQIASAVFVTSSKEPVSPLARAINIAPSRAETNSLAFPLAAAVWAPALSKTRISQSSFARKNSRTSAETSAGTPSTSAPIIPQRHMRPSEGAARDKRT